MASPQTQPPIAAPASRLRLTSGAVALLLTFLVSGCVSDPSPHPGVDPDYTPANGVGDVRSSDTDDMATPGGDVVGESPLDGCDPQGGDVMGDVGPDACSPTDVVTPPDGCGPGSADGHEGAGSDACGGEIPEGSAGDSGPQPANAGR